MLTSIPPNIGCNLVFIFGNARSGKSFLMNQLVSCAPVPVPPNLFEVKNLATTCTKGVDISSAFIPQLGLHKDATKDERKLMVGFVDVEGQGDAGEQYDTLLALPLLLTSKVVLFNHKGAPTVSHMLERLGVLARGAQKVRAGFESFGAEPEGKAEEGEVEKDEKALAKQMKKASKAIATLATLGHEHDQPLKKKNYVPKLFGHLHIIFRDFSFEGDETSVLNQLLKEELVPIQKKSLGGRGVTYDPSESIRDRNEIRRLIKENFESVSAWIFPQPASPDTLKEYHELPQDKISKPFLAVTQRLFAAISTQTAEPRIFNGKLLDGPRVYELLQLLTDAINKNTVIDVPSIFRAMEQQRLVAAKDASFAKLEQMLNDLQDDFPMAIQALTTRISEATDASVQLFEQMTANTTLAPQAEAMKEYLRTSVLETTSTITQRNESLAWVLVDHTLKNEASTLVVDFRKWCAEHMGAEEEEIELNYKRLKEDERARIESALQKVPQVLNTPEYTERLMASEERAESLLAVKLAQNASYLLDVKARKIAEVAEQQRLELVAKNEQLLAAVMEIKTGENSRRNSMVVAQNAETLKLVEEKEKQIQAQATKLKELSRERDRERVEKEKLAKQLAEIAEKAEREKEEAKLLEMQVRKIHKEGWLFMRSKFLMRKTWKRRYFRVESGVLVRYANIDCKERKGFLGINPQTSINPFDPRGLDNKQLRYAFQVISDNTCLVLRPVEEDEAAASKCQKEWVAYLKCVGAGLSADSAATVGEEGEKKQEGGGELKEGGGGGAVSTVASSGAAVSAGNDTNAPAVTIHLEQKEDSAKRKS